jgi:RNA-binding protein
LKSHYFNIIRKNEQPMNFTEKQKQSLRRQGHGLRVLVQTGQHGLTPAVINQIKEALHDHELIKVRVLAGDREEKKEMIEAIVSETESTLIQSVGHMILLYKLNPKRNRISFE